MLSLLKYEFYKLFHNKGMLIFTVILLVIVLWMGSMGLYSRSELAESWEKGTRSYTFGSMYGLFDVTFESFEQLWNWYPTFGFSHRLLDQSATAWVMVIFFPGYFVSIDFRNRTIIGPLTCGRSRWQIFASKLISYYLLAAIFSIVSSLLVIWWYIPQSFSVIPTDIIIRSFALRLLSDLAVGSIPLIIVFCVKNMLFSVIISFAYMMGLNIPRAAGVPVPYFNAYWLKDFLYSLTPEMIKTFCITCVVYIVIGAAGAYPVFSRSQFK